MKFAIFDNSATDNSIKASINGTHEVSLRNMTNDKNIFKSHLKEKIYRHEVMTKTIKMIENAIASMNSFEFVGGFGKDLSGDPVFVGMDFGFNKAVIVMKDRTTKDSRWRSFSVVLSPMFTKSKKVSAFTGNPLVIKKNVVFVEDAKLTALNEKIDSNASEVQSELELMKREIERLKKELREQKLLVSAYSKERNKKELNDDEQLALFFKEYKVELNKEVNFNGDKDLEVLFDKQASEQVSNFSNNSTVFMIASPDESINKQTIVCSEQSIATTETMLSTHNENLTRKI